MFASDRILSRVEIVSREEYKERIGRAKLLLGKHEKDIEFIALCLQKNCKLWTYEKLLIDIGFGITTKEVSDLSNL